MKILFVSNNYLPYQSGVTRSLQTSIATLQKYNHNILLVVPDFQTNVYDPDYVKRIPAWFTIKYHTNKLPLLKQRKNFLKQHIQDFLPNLIHVHHPFLLGKDALRIAKHLHIPIVFTFHYQYDQYIQTLLVKKIYSFCIWRYLQWFCNQINITIFPTYTLKKLVQKHITVKSSAVIPSAIDDIFFKKRNNNKNFHQPFKLLYIGRLATEKNIPILLQVINKLKLTCTLELVGYGHATTFLQHYAYNELALSKKDIIFTLKPSRSTIIEKYRCADLFIFSSIRETQGLVLAEAMASGLPVIAFNAAGSRDIICNGYNGFLVDSIEQMVNKISLLIKNPRLYSTLCINAQQTAQNYTSKQHYKQLLNSYQKLTTSHL